MGFLITIDPVPPGSNYTKWIVKRATSQSGTFNNVSTITISDDGHHYWDKEGTSSSWYKTAYLEDNEENEYETSDAFQPHNEQYCKIRDIQSFFQRSTAFSATSNPSVQQVANIIQQKQDEIDNATGHAWRKRYSGTKTGENQSAQYEYHDIDFGYEYHTGRPIYLDHRHIYSMDSDAGDALEVWDGSNWENYLTQKTEGRADDFWFDYSAGMIFLRMRFGVVKPRALRIKYRYGETVLPRQVRLLCMKMVATELMYSESRSVLIPEGSNNLTHRDKVERWEKDIEGQLQRLREFKVLPTYL